MPTIIADYPFDSTLGGAEVETSNAAIVASPAYQGAGSMHVADPGAFAWWRLLNLSSQVLVCRLYFRMAAFPADEVAIAQFIDADTTGYGGGVVWDTDQLRTSAFGSSTQLGLYGGPTLSLDTWYRLDTRVDITSSNIVVDAQINGDDLAQASTAKGSITELTTVVVSDYLVSGEAEGRDIYADSLLVSYTASDYPLGDVVVAGREYKRFYGPAQLSGTAATLYTVPAGKLARIRQIHVSNPSAGAVDYTLSVGVDAVGTRMWDDYAIASESTFDHRPKLALAAGESIQALAGTAGTLVLTIDGWEEPA